SISVRRAPWLGPAALGLVALLSLRTSVQAQSRAQGQLPVEVLASARTLRRLARPGDAVIARKGHVAYHAGLRPVPFPFVRRLPELAAYARREHARWLYMSWP